MFTAFLATVALTVSSQDAPAPIEQMAWLAGAWSCQIWGGTFEERWSPPAGGTMQGSGRLIVGGKTTFMEFMSIEQGEDGLVMWMLLGAPSAGEKKPVPFKLIEHESQKVVFEREGDDYPKRITYRQTEEALACVLEGHRGGKPVKDIFDYKAIPR